MNLLSPEPGLVIWSTFAFLVLFFLLRKFAWNPILEAIKSREEKVAQSLEAAQKATEELKNMEALRAKMATEARQEKDLLLKEARAMKDKIVDEARQSAQVEAERIMANAKAQIEKDKADAVAELKQQVAKLSVEIAGRILAENLQTTNKQEELIERYLKESSFN